MTRYVFDTDHLSLLQRGHKPLLARIEQHAAGELAITIVTVEEQLRGRLAQVRKAANPEQLAQSYKWLRETFDSLARLGVLDFDEAASRVYTDLLRQKIRIGTHDLRIAAIVIANDAVLVTRNMQDFANISEVRLENWAD